MKENRVYEKTQKIELFSWLFEVSFSVERCPLFSKISIETIFAILSCNWIHLIKISSKHVKRSKKI